MIEAIKAHFRETAEAWAEEATFFDKTLLAIGVAASMAAFPSVANSKADSNFETKTGAVETVTNPNILDALTTPIKTNE